MVALALVSCTFRVPIEPLAFDVTSLRLGETDFSQLVRAIDRVELEGTAQLRPGRFALTTESYAALEIEGPTRVDFHADVSLASATDGGSRLQVQPTVRRFTLRFDRPVVLHGRGDNRRVTLRGASLSEEVQGAYDVDVKVGRSVMGTIASAIVGVPAGLDAAPVAFEMLDRIELPEARASLRPGARLEHGASVVVLAQGSSVVLRHVDVNVAAGVARMDFEGALRAGSGTCLGTGEGRLCAQSVSLALHGDYQHSDGPGAPTQRLRLAQLDRPTVLEIERGQLGVSGATEELPIHRARVQLHRYECAGTNAQRCAYTAETELEVGEGAVQLGGRRLRFAGLEVHGARFSQEPSGRSVLVEGVVLTEPTLELADVGAEARFERLTIDGLQGASWGALQLASGSVRATDGVMEFTLGGSKLTARLVGETRLVSTRSETLRLTPSGLPVETPEAGDLSLRARLEDVRLALDGAPFATAADLSLDATLGQTAVLELRSRRAVEVDSSALGVVALGTARLDFRTLRLTRDEAGTRLRAEGLTLSLPQQNVLTLLRMHIPATFVGDETPLDPSLERALASAARAVELGSLSRFRARVQASGLDRLGLSFERGQLRLEGDVDVRVQVVANAHRVRIQQCSHQVTGTVGVPCFEAGLPSLCDRAVSVAVPYPCPRDEHTDTVLLDRTGRVGIDLSGEVVSNAPARLGELTLTARLTRCERIDLRGIDDWLERLLDIEGLLCERLSAVSETVALGELLDLASAPPLTSAQVERLAIDSDDTDLRLAFDVEFLLDRAPEP